MSRTVHVLTYAHRHGADVSVYTTEEEALHAAIDIILDWLDDVTDAATQQRILKKILSGDYRETLKIWSEWQNEAALEYESLVIEEMPVGTESPTARVLYERACKAQKELKEGTSGEPD